MARQPGEPGERAKRAEGSEPDEPDESFERGAGAAIDRPGLPPSLLIVQETPDEAHSAGSSKSGRIENRRRDSEPRQLST